MTISFPTEPAFSSYVASVAKATASARDTEAMSEATRAGLSDTFNYWTLLFLELHTPDIDSYSILLSCESNGLQPAGTVCSAAGTSDKELALTLG